MESLKWREMEDVFEEHCESWVPYVVTALTVLVVLLSMLTVGVVS